MPIMISKIFLVLAVVITTGCDTSTFKKAANSPLVISVDLEKKRENIGEVFEDVTIIPLETSGESLFGRVSIVQTYGEYIFIYERFSQLLMSFDKDGRFITNYIRSGKGPGETASTMSFRVDEDKNEVVVFSWDKRANIFFKIDGSFLREEPMVINNEGMHKFGDGYVAYYTGKPKNFINNEPNNSTLIILDKDNQETFVGVEVPYIKQSGYVLYQSFHTYRNNLFFKYPYGDTIYQVFPDHIEGKYVIDFGKDRIDWDDIDKEQPRKIHFEIKGKSMASINHFFWEFENWLVFAITQKGDYYYAFYNKLAKEINIYNTKTLVNYEFGILGRIIGATETEVIFLVEPLDLLYPDNEINEPQNKAFALRLSNLIKEIKPTDNPVLLKFELK